MSYEKEQIMMQERRERIAAKCLQGLLASGKYHNAPMLAAVDDAVSYTSVMMAVLDGKPVSSEYPDAYLHVNRERPDMRGVSLSHDESGYNTHYDTFPLYRHPAPGWQPIETVPKGESVDLCAVYENGMPFYYPSCYWREGGVLPEGWVSRYFSCERRVVKNATHWKPLTQMPEVPA